jgi:protein arginine kinase
VNLPDKIVHHIPWGSQSDPIWPASNFSLYRNIAGYPFSEKLNEHQSSQLVQILKSVLAKIPALEQPIYLPAQALSSQEKEFLCEHFLCQTRWPNASKGQAFVFDASAQFLAVCNAKEHLLLEWIDFGGSWQQTWELLNQVERALGEKIEYAFSSKFGYLTSDPCLCGTALVVYCYLHLPALIFSGTLFDVLQNLDTKNVEVISVLGEHQNFMGDLLILKNSYTLGVTEDSILQSLHAAANQLVLAEKNTRAGYRKDLPIELKDKISRAYGLLLHSCQLDAKEAFDALSQIKLGTDLGCIRGMSDAEMNALFFGCRRAHLLQTQETFFLPPKDLAKARSLYLHQKLQKTNLHF